MHGNTMKLKLSLTALALFTLCSCQPSLNQGSTVMTQPTPQVIIQGDNPGREETQTIDIDNCDGKADATRTEERSQSIEVTISLETAAKLGGEVKVISAEAQAAIAAATTWGKQRRTSIQLSAPPKTRMVFQLVWIGDERIGILENFRGAGIPIAFRGFDPTDVRIKGQYDLGCPTPSGVKDSVIATPERLEQPQVTSPQPGPQVHDFQNVSLRQIGTPEDSNLGLEAGINSLLDIPFETGWTVTTQCADRTSLPTAIEVPTTIPNPINVYMLIQAGWGMQQFAGKEIGAISLTFSDGTNGRTIRVPLIIGGNIRDWARHNPAAVTSATSPTLREAWSGTAPDGVTIGGIDMLTIEIPTEYRHSTLTNIEIADTSIAEVASENPCIHLLALTVEHLR